MKRSFFHGFLVPFLKEKDRASIRSKHWKPRG
jgi:hypothetical protein